jgi:hypothetical protein
MTDGREKNDEDKQEKNRADNGDSLSFVTHRGACSMTPARGAAG